MNVLMLGGSGFVGGHLARRLSERGHRVTIATRYAPGARHLAVIPRLRIRAFDPYDVDALAGELAGHDALINLVGILNERGFGGAGFRRAHVTLVEGAIEACRVARVERFVHMSALNAGNGESHYLITRGQGEARVRESQLDWTMFRPSTIFGPDDSFLNRFAGLLAISPVLPLARPAAKFAPVWVGDVVEAFARALDTDESKGACYELCGSETWALADLVRWVARQRGMRRAVIGLPDALGWLQGKAFDLVPGKPFSSDNFKSLAVDSLCSEPGFDRLGIEPWGLSEKAVDWLSKSGRQSRYRRFRERARRG